MEKKLGNKCVSMLVIGIMVLSTIVVAVTVSASIGNLEVPNAGTNEQLLGNKIVAGEPTALSKIQPSLRQVALDANKGRTKVMIATSDASELSELLSVYRADMVAFEDFEREKTFIGTDAVSAPGKLTTKTVDIPNAALIEIAELSGVVGIFTPKDVAPLSRVDPEMEEFKANIMEKLRNLDLDAVQKEGGASILSKGGQPPSPMDWSIVNEHGAADAWNEGYDGTGVNIAVVDTGVDFAQPNLVGQWAVVDDPLSPYDGWPIMWNPDSMDLLLDYWTHYIYPYPVYATYGESSWYSDTNYIATLDNDGISIIVDGDPADWPVGGLVAQDPAGDMTDPSYDLTYLYVGSGYEVSTDQLGWFIGLNATTSSGDNTTYVVYIDTIGETYGYDEWSNDLGIVDEEVITSTLWETTASLDHPVGNEKIVSGSVSLYFEDGTTFEEGVDFTVSLTTGAITFTDPLYPGHTLYADYFYGETDVTSNSFSTGNLVSGTVDVYLNGDEWGPTGNYTINLVSGIITYTSALAPGDVVEAEYDYNSGATFDAFGYAVNTVSASMPESAIYMQHDPSGDLFFNPVGYKWEGKAWSSPVDVVVDLGGLFAYDGTNDFIEMFIPKTEHEFDPTTINVEVFSTGNFTGNHAQDTVASDPNVGYTTPDWTAVTTTLSTFTSVDSGFLGYYMQDIYYTKRYDPDDFNGDSNPYDLAFIERNYYIGNIATGANPEFHLGIAKDDKLTMVIGERVGMLVVDSDNNGVYDTVYVDFDNDKNFADEKPTNKTSPLAYADYFDESLGIWDTTSWNTGDGYPDLTAGLLYFIADTEADVVDETLTFTEWTSDETTYFSTMLAHENIVADIIGFLDPFTVTLANDSGDLPFSEFAGDFTIDYNTGNITFEASVFDPTGMTVTANYSYGLPIPYSDVYSKSEGYANYIPADADFVCMFGDFDLPEYHGTSCASNAVGKPIPGYNFGELGNVFGFWQLDADAFGTAPGAKIIGIGNFYNSPGYDSWYFAVEGYDGIPGTGDEASVVSNSWGSPTIHEDGWNFASRLAYDITTNYAPHSTFCAATGNDGWGYGTTTSPGSAPGVIGVGGGITQNYRTDWLFESDGGPIGNHSHYPCPFGGDEFGPYGDIVDFSGRGPSALGAPEPDVIAVGAYAVGGVPINDPWNYLVDAWGYSDGLGAHNLWGGTSLSTPVTAGVVALMYQAYNDTHPAQLTSTMAKNILMSTADDHQYDVLQQGAGWINALRAVKAAADIEGVTSDTPFWVPGDYDGVHRDAFVNLLEAGESDIKTVTLTNHDPLSAAVTVTDAVFERKAEISFDWIFLDTGRQWACVVNDTGIYEPDTGNLLGVNLGGVNLAARWNDADFVKVITYPTEMDQVIARGDSYDMYYELFVFTDMDGNDIFDSGTSYPLPEVNRIGWSVPGMNTAPAMCAVYSPSTRLNDGLAISMRDYGGTNIPILYTTVLEFYKKADWTWVTTTAPGTVSGGGTGTFDVTVSVPSDAAVGGYEGAVYYNDGGNTTVIPLFVNVPATSSPMEFGGNIPSTTLYDNNGVIGSGGGSGDWRFYFADVDLADADNRKMVMGTEWTSELADCEMYLFTQTPDAQFTDDAQFGPFSLIEVAATKDAIGATDTSYKNKEFLPNDEVATGLFELAVKNVAMEDESESIEGDVGYMVTTPIAAEISTNQLSGGKEISVYSNIDMVDGLGTAVTASEVHEELNLEVYVDDLSPPFPDIFLTTKVQKIQSVPVDTISVKFHIQGHSDAPDLDLGVYYDENGDGVPQSGELIQYCADGDADEWVTLMFPPAGDYISCVLGYSCGAPGHFDYKVTLLYIGVSAFTAENGPTSTVPAATPTSFDLSWEFTELSECEIAGMLFVSPGHAPYALVQEIQITFLYDLTPPTIVEPAPKGIINDNMPTLMASLFDNDHGELDRASVKMSVDGIDVTDYISVSMPYDKTTKYGVGAVSYTPTTPLSDDTHSATVEVSDFAGNVATYSWDFVVDTGTPRLTIDIPSADIATNTATITISGTTEPGVTLTIPSRNDTAVSVNDDGTFSTVVELLDGKNAIQFKAVDVAGNAATLTRTITLDTSTPSFLGITTSKTLTNEEDVIISGRINEYATLTVNGESVMVYADGTFSTIVGLVEGTNTITLVANDMAGNTYSDTITVTKDTIAPALAVDSLPTMVREGTITVSGTSDGQVVTINGQVVVLTNGAFSKDIELSYGANTIVVTSMDSVGNIQELNYAIEFTPLQVNYSPIVLMVILLIIGLLIGYFIGGRPKAPVEEMPPEEMPEEEIEEEIPVEEDILEELPEEVSEEELTDEEILEEEETKEEEL